MKIQIKAAHLFDAGSVSSPVQMYLAHKKPRPPRTLQYYFAQVHTVALGGVLFLMSEVPLYHAVFVFNKA